MGAAGRAARGGAQHLPADAAARAATPSATRRTRRSVTKAFVEEATATGIDIYRIFDALNNVESMRPAIDAVRETGTAIAEVAMSYTGDLSDPGENLYTLDYYLKLAEQIVDAGAHVLAIKDMAGLLRPQAATALVSALRSRFDLPVHVHTHDTPGGQLATYVAAWQAGASAVDGASAPLAGTTSQPALSLDRGGRRAHRVRHRAVAVGGLRSGAVLGGAAKGVRAVRVRAARADRAGCITTRSPAVSCRTCASRPSRSGSGTGSRRSRRTTPPPTGCSAGW